MVMGAVGAAGAIAGTLGDALGLTKNKKATLEVVKGDWGDPVGGKTSLEVMFNPTSYQINLAATINETQNSAKSGGNQEFGGTNPMTFSCQLFFDEFHKPKGDVTPKISTLLDWMRPTEQSVKDCAPKAPHVKFKWGGNKQLEGFQGFLTKCNVTYSLFTKDGTPIRAKVDIEIRGATPEKPFGNPTSHAAGSHRAHTMIDGDTLQSIAFRELGRPAYWRALAELNGIDDPLRLSAGTVVLIPSKADAATWGIDE